jgi:hypothetical protein
MMLVPFSTARVNNMKTRHGVLTSEGVLSIRNNQWHMMPVGIDGSLVPWIENLSDLCKIAVDAGLTHLWVHAEANVEPQVSFEINKGCFKGIEHGWDIMGHMEGSHVKSAHAWPATGGDAVDIIFPAYSGWGKSNRMNVPGWAAVATPKQLLVTISYLERKLEVPMGGSPGSTGWNLHKKLHPDWSKESPLMKAVGDIFRESAGPDFTTQREYDPDEGLYLHKIDKNSAYLQACKFDSFYGVGDPVQDKNGSKFDGKSPGAWLCTVDPVKVEFPGYPAGTYWIATPVVRLMQKDENYSVEIHEGWYWQFRDKKDSRPSDAHQVMAKWAQLVWETRQFFVSTEDKAYRHKECCAFATSAMKQIATATVGLSGSKKFGDEDTDKRRPDIRSQTISRSYELMYWNVMKFAELTELVPLFTYNDALYYVSDSPQVPFPDVFLKRQKDLGGFKYEGYIHITPDVVEALSDETSVSKKLEFLNKKGWVK